MFGDEGNKLLTGLVVQLEIFYVSRTYAEQMVSIK